MKAMKDTHPVLWFLGSHGDCHRLYGLMSNLPSQSVNEASIA